MRVDPFTLDTMRQAMMVCRIAKEVDAEALEDALYQLNRADAIDPIIDPSTYREQMHDIDDVRACIEAVQILQAAVDGVDLDRGDEAEYRCQLCRLEAENADVELLGILNPYIDLEADVVDWEGFARHLSETFVDVDVDGEGAEHHMETHQVFAMGGRGDDAVEGRDAR